MSFPHLGGVLKLGFTSSFVPISPILTGTLLVRIVPTVEAYGSSWRHRSGQWKLLRLFSAAEAEGFLASWL
jgi:hypothetical protein